MLSVEDSHILTISNDSSKLMEGEITIEPLPKTVQYTIGRFENDTRLIK